jgi:hypothetical protein
VLVALAAAGSRTIGMAARAPAQSTVVHAEGCDWVGLRGVRRAMDPSVGDVARRTANVLPARRMRVRECRAGR